MNINRIIFLFTLPALSLAGHAEFIFTENIGKAWSSIQQLKIDSAFIILGFEEQDNQGNDYIPYYFHYAGFIRVLVSGDTEIYDDFRNDSENLMNRIKKAKQDHAEYLVCLSAMNLQMSILHFYFQEPLKGLRNLYLSYRMAKENQNLFPGNPDNMKMLGILEAIFSAVPEEYGWIVRWFGLSADHSAAIFKLEQYWLHCKKEDKFEAIIILYLAYDHFYSGQDRSYKLLTDYVDEYGRLTLYRYFLAYSAFRSGYALSSLQNLINQRQPDGEMWFGQLTLLAGKVGLSLLREDAGQYLLKFLDNYKGENNIKTAWHYLSWYYLINENYAGYEEARRQVLEHGNAFFESDRQAQTEAGRDGIPNVTLLKSRLLFDGSRYAQALNIILETDTTLLTDEEEKVEYLYRLARIYHELSKKEMAKAAYEEVVLKGSGKSWYFAPNSALQLGYLEEEEGNYDRAFEYYQKCLKINKGEYKNSIERKARIGLDRVEEAMMTQ